VLYPADKEAAVACSGVPRDSTAVPAKPAP
jgi:hypothetical protein